MGRLSISGAVVLLFHRSDATYERLVGAGMSAEAARIEVAALIRRYNRWGCELGRQDERFFPFVGINPRYFSPSEIRDEIAACAELGARGVKIIPSSLRMYADDELLSPVYESAVELRLPVLSQSGIGSGAAAQLGGDPYGRPKYFANVLQKHAGLQLILAHMGLGFDEDMAELMERFPLLVGDTSGRLGGLGHPGRPTEADVAGLIKRLGVDRVFFGTNYPIYDPAGYVAALERLPMPDQDRELVAAGNFERVVLHR